MTPPVVRPRPRRGPRRAGVAAAAAAAAARRAAADRRRRRRRRAGQRARRARAEVDAEVARAGGGEQADGGVAGVVGQHVVGAADAALGGGVHGVGAADAALDAARAAVVRVEDDEVAAAKKEPEPVRTPKAAVKLAPKAPELSTMKRAPKEAPMNTEERELLEAARLIAEAQKRSKMRRANLTKVRAPQFDTPLL